MVLGYHVIFSAYGFWLPNDPRGSWSEFVGSWELFRFGPATKTESRVSVAARSHDVTCRLSAKDALNYPPVEFIGVQARAIGRGFAESIRKGGVTVWACSILPNHVHLVIGRHSSQVEQLVNFLKGEATKSLVAEDLHPFAECAAPSGKIPNCWAAGQWKVYLDSVEDITRSIQYVEANPIKEGKPAQRWPFVVPFDPASFSREPRANASAARSPEARG
jgi:REP element-mobilizing transposase RayT